MPGSATKDGIIEADSDPQILDDETTSEIENSDEESFHSCQEDFSFLNIKEPPTPSHLFSPRKISTPKRISASLGCKQNTSNVSWTSSMDTPNTSKIISPINANDTDKALVQSEGNSIDKWRSKPRHRRRRVVFEPSANVEMMDETFTGCDQSTSPIITSNCARQLDLNLSRSPRTLFDEKGVNADAFVSPEISSALTFLFDTPPTSEDVKSRRKRLLSKPRKRLTDDDVLTSLIRGNKCSDEMEKDNLRANEGNDMWKSFNDTWSEEELMNVQNPTSPVIFSSKQQSCCNNEVTCDNSNDSTKRNASQVEFMDDNSLSATFPSDVADAIETALKLAELGETHSSAVVVNNGISSIEGGIKRRTDCDRPSSENSKKIKKLSEFNDDLLACEIILRERFTQVECINLQAINSETTFKSATSTLKQSNDNAAVTPEKAQTMFGEDTEKSPIINQPRFVGFSTASGRGITISKAALNKAKQLLVEDEEMPEIDNGNKKDNLETSANHPVTTFSFSTAGGKDIKVSSDAVKNAKIRFQENVTPEKEHCSGKSKIQSNSATTGYVGFSTATGKNINVSNKALMKAKQIFLEDDDNNFGDCDKSDVLKVQNNSCKNTETVTRESEESKVKQNEQESESESHPPADFKGFATAAGKKVRISEESLAKAQLMMDNVATDSNASETTASANIDSEVEKSIAAFLQDEVIAQDHVANHREIVAKSFRVHPLRQEARNIQESKIAAKRCHIIRPSEGELYRQKILSAENRISLRKFVDRKCPGSFMKEQLRLHGVKICAMNVNADNAEDFKFDAREYLDHYDDVTSVEFAFENGTSVILDDAGFVGKLEFYRTLITDSSVDEKLISIEWVFNHYRWIVWKLATMELRFPEIFANRCLTVERVMLQLKYRYDREIDKGHRSALKKIIERDDSSAKTMVLCVSKIVQLENSDIYVEATDGWYKIGVEVDGYLKHLIRTNKIFVGQKIITHNAELIGSAEACSPLEAPPNLKLKISGNSTRIARWDTKLGYFSNPRPFVVSLSSISPDGCIISCTEAVIARIYPIQFMERVGERYIFRDERAENKAAAFHEKFRLNLQEKIMTKILRQMEMDICEDKCKQRIKSPQFKDIRKLRTGEEIFEIFEGKADIENADALLSLSQKNLLYEFRNKVLDKKRELFEKEVLSAVNEEKEAGRFPDDRVIVPFTRLLLTGISSADDNKYKKTLILTIWRPTEEADSLREGDAVRLFYTNATRRGNRYGDTQLSSTRRTKFEKFTVNSQVHFTAFTPRKLCPFRDLSESNCNAPYNQVDVVGFVIRIPERRVQRGGCQIIYLADDSANIIGIRFWNGLSFFTSHDRIRIGQFVAGINLEKSAKNSSHSIGYLTAIEMSMFTQLPKYPHLKNALEELKTKIGNSPKLLHEVTEKLNLLTADELNPKFLEVSPLSTKVQEQSEQCKRKIGRLMGMGIPPPLNSLTTPSSKSTRRGFKSPFRKT